jgi:acyl-coenzyme A synthetase/AMP-(fatty) acid ligase
MPTFPIITHPGAESVIAWRDGKAITAARFLADIALLRARLPAARHMLNACTDRYRFMVGLAAALTSEKVCLLPSTQTPEMIRQMTRFAPDAFCLADTPDCDIALPQVGFPDLDAGTRALPADQPYLVPQVDASQLVAYVFTSGSTGVPVPHAKTWGALVRNVQAEAQLWGMSDERSHSVIGTVPPQHMYGFESTVLIVMLTANAMVAGKSFYPIDICNAIAQAPRPRTLVSTPVHLRSVLGAELDVPPVDLVVSATAPLSVALAEELETAFDAPLLEIYGSTETGQIAVRRSTKTQEWRLFPDVRFHVEGGVTWASGGHVEKAMPMHDVIELVGDDRFLLHGRTADLVNIAGKRSSLAYLNLQLIAVPGVVDGAFFMPDEIEADGVTRLTAFVVAPGATPASVMRGLRERIDPVFLPRPLHFVDALPRNATGKLPREALKALLQEKAGLEKAGQNAGSNA